MDDTRRTRHWSGRRTAAHNAGVFLAPGMRFAVPLRTLSDDYRDQPSEQDEEPEPEPAVHGVVSRVVDRLVRRTRLRD